jgi:hypothetical protein
VGCRSPFDKKSNGFLLLDSRKLDSRELDLWSSSLGSCGRAKLGPTVMWAAVYSKVFYGKKK